MVRIVTNAEFIASLCFEIDLIRLEKLNYATQH